MEDFAFQTPACTAFTRKHPELCTAAYHYSNDDIPRKHLLSMVLILNNLFRCPATLMTLDLLFGNDLAGRLYSFADEVRSEIVKNIVAMDRMEIEMERFIEGILGGNAGRVPWLLDLYRYESTRLCIQVLPDWRARQGIVRNLEYDIGKIAHILLNERTLPSQEGFSSEYTVWYFSTSEGFRRALLPRSLGDQLNPEKS